MTTSIMEDKREIKAIFWADETNYTVGRSGVEKIEPYYENGQIAEVVWFAIYCNGEIEQRVNMTNIDTISYV